MSSNPDRVSVGRYLATRLVEVRTHHVFGLPGDFNLNLLDEMTATSGLSWVGSANELNAAYTADGYARVGRRVGALVTTFGVGELSALNGIAGSFAEDVPVLHIAGLPARASMQARLPLHHTLLDGDYEHFVRMFREVTVADAVLGAPGADPGAEIDRVITAMITASKPGYLGVPLDVARMQISSEPLSRSLAPLPSDPGALAAFERALTARAATSETLVVLAGHQVHRRSLETDVASLAALPGVRIASQTGSKAILDEDHPASLGTYLGATTKIPLRRAAVDDAALLVLVGTVFSDFTTGFFSHGYDQGEAIELGIEQARIGHAVYSGVRLEDSLAALRRVVEAVCFAPIAPILDQSAEAIEPPANDAELDHAHFWPEIQRWLQPVSTIAAEAGTAFYGALDLTLPGASDLLGQPIWSSIGYTLPATFGGALARPDRRPVLFIGDGSAQLTIQELGHLYRSATGAVVFLLDNDGYTVERRIQSPDAGYQDIVRWEWDLIPAALGARDVSVLHVSTVEQLRAALTAVRYRECAAFIRVVLPKYDAPRLLVALADGISSTNAE